MKHLKRTMKMRKQLALHQWTKLLDDKPRVQNVSMRVPNLDMKGLEKAKRSIFNLDDIDNDEFATFISQKNENGLELI